VGYSIYLFELPVAASRPEPGDNRHPP